MVGEVTPLCIIVLSTIDEQFVICYNIAIMTKNKLVALLLLYTNTIAFVSWLILSLGLGLENFATAFLAGSVVVGVSLVSPLAAIRLFRSENK